MEIRGAPTRQRSKISILFTSTARILFATLLFTAGGMAVGLFIGIISMLALSLISGRQVDMSHAYKNVAIPLALTLGAVAFCGATYLEIRSRRTSR